MSSTDIRGESPQAVVEPGTVDMKLEVMAVPVSDIDRAKRFYQGLGWRTDAELTVGEHFRVVQITPTRSACSIVFGIGVTTAQPGSAQHLELAVHDIDVARDDLISRGVDVSEVFHYDAERRPVAGPDPQRASYGSYASFADPDGNAWLLQEITNRHPGRVWEG
jgi:catechol 2,3-dioxygenase-like lactoylglutathione lyase family enzyme